MKTVVVSMPWGKNLSKNHNCSGRKRWYKTDVQGWMNRLGWEVKAAMMKAGIRAFHPPVTVVVDFRYPDGRKRDSHNYFETICDALKDLVGVDALLPHVPVLGESLNLLPPPPEPKEEATDADWEVLQDGEG